MAKTFYPFVDGDDNTADQEGLANPSSSARIAVYDSMTMAPRVEIIEPTDIRTYLDEITKTVFELASQQGGDWSFMLIRELVENFIHASFIEPSISILDKGQTLVFSDQGPGIPNKPAALKPSFSSATKAMKRYIRGVGSGLPIVEEQLKLRNGTLTIEDNLGHGTIVTVSLVPGRNDCHQTEPEPPASSSYPAAPTPMGYPSQTAGPIEGCGMQQPPYPYGNPYVGGGYPNVVAPYGMQPQAQFQPPQPQQPYGYPGAYGYQPQPQPYPGYPMGCTVTSHMQTAPNPYGYGGAPMPNYQPYGAYGAYGAAEPGGLEDQSAFPVQPVPMAPIEPAQTPANQPATGHVQLTKEHEDILRLFAHIERVGGVDLTRELGMAPATASRRLTALAKAGHIIKEEGKQKYMLTGEGELVLAQLLKSEG